MADPVTWRDVILALSGAPVGALIAVGGVQLTNRQNQATQQALIEAQANQRRAQLEADLLSSLQKQTLSTRSELYEGLLSESERALSIAKWTSAEVVEDHGPVSNEDLLPLWTGVRNVRFKALVHCSAPVRFQIEQFAVAVEQVSDTAESGDRDRLVVEARRRQQCVIEAAVADRSRGVSEDGLGGM